MRQRFLEYPSLSGQIPAVAADAGIGHSGSGGPGYVRCFPTRLLVRPIQLVLAPNFDAKSGVLRNRTSVLVFAVDSLILGARRYERYLPA